MKMRKTMNAIAALVLVGAQAVRANELSFGAPVQVGTYSVLFADGANSKLQERVGRFATAAQAEVPQLAFDARIYVVPRPIKGTATAATVQLPSGAVAILIDPKFGKMKEREQEMVFAHELVHAKLLLMGLGDGDQCKASAHEQIAYSVSVKMERDFDKARATRAHVAKLRDFVQANCDGQEFAAFYAEFGVEQ
jgi:predicted metallopeptidase